MVRLEEATDEHKHEDDHKVVHKRLHHGDLEGDVERSDQHEEDAARPQDGSDHHHHLVDDVEVRDVIVVPHHVSDVHNS